MVNNMEQSEERWPTFDEIDSVILRMLAEDPRKPYSEIAADLANEGYDMSDEGVRYRVEQILEATTVFFLLDPRETEWELVRLAITVIDESGARNRVFEFLQDMPFWHVSVGLGSYDVYAVGSLPNVEAVDRTLMTIQEYDAVESADHIIVTDRNRDMSSYVSTDYIAVDEEPEE